MKIVRRKMLSGNKSILILSAYYLVFVISSSHASAYTIEGLKITPFVSVKYTATDNVFTTSTQRKRDRITSATPGIRLSLPFRAHKANVSYNAVLMRYEKYRSEKTDDHSTQGDIHFNVGSRFWLRIDGEYDKKHEPRSDSSTGFLEKFTLKKHKTSIIYQLMGRSKIEIDYAVHSWKFRQSTYRDRSEGVVSGFLYYRFLPNTSAFIEHDRKTVDFNEITVPYDNKAQSSLIGLTWDATRRSKGTVKFGKHKKIFNDASIKDTKGNVSLLNIEHHFTDSTTTTLLGERSYNETNRLFTRYYIASSIGMEVNHRFGYRMSGSIRSTSETVRYSDPLPTETIARADDILTVGGSAKYLLRDWMEVGFDYTYRSRDSNQPINNYRDHRYSAILSAYF